MKFVSDGVVREFFVHIFISRNMSFRITIESRKHLLKTFVYATKLRKGENKKRKM